MPRGAGSGSQNGGGGGGRIAVYTQGLTGFNTANFAVTGGAGKITAAPARCIWATSTPRPYINPTCLISNPTDQQLYRPPGIWNVTGVGQTKTQTVNAGGTATYLLPYAISGFATDSFTITASAAAAGWTMRFFDTASGNDITAAITGNGWSVCPLAPDAQQNFYVQLLPSTTLTTGAVDTLTVTAVSVNDATRLDVAIPPRRSPV